MDKKDANIKRQSSPCSSTFYCDTDSDIPVRRLTDTGTLYTDVGQSKFFDENTHRHSGNSMQRTQSLTGSTVVQTGSSQFYTKPPLSELAYTPPQIITKEQENMPARKLAKSGTVKFPQLKEFAHFHYTSVTLGNIQTYIDTKKHVELGSYYDVFVVSNGQTWIVQRKCEHFKLLDKQLHYCVFDRKYSKLPILATELDSSSQAQEVSSIISQYLIRFSELTENSVNCGTVLNFFELNSSGGRLISPVTESAINIPAIAAALVTKAYHAKDYDELELKVGDLISVIDKPPPNESSWWRGKKELLVGFFPSECVEVIGGSRKSTSSVISTTAVPEEEKLPVLRRRDKVIAFLRQFFLHRPARSQLKQSGIVKERVFGTDLGEYITNSALLLPRILTCCCEAIEQHGIIDGIYRLSGRAVLVQKLRDDFDMDRHDAFTDEEIIDIHAISTLLKCYFRELPNPLLTFQLYDAMVSCVQLRQTAKKISALKSHLMCLPPTHYRTAKYLFSHLSQLSKCSKRTSMTTRNLAIVWAPNLMRYDDKTGVLNAFAQLSNVSLQAAVMELLIAHYDQIFTDDNEQAPNLHDSQKPHVQPLSNRLLSLTIAQKRKRRGKGTRDYNSSAEYPVMPSHREQRSDSEPAGGLNRSMSVSLDSVFTPSSSAMGESSVHLLTGPDSIRGTSEGPYQDIDKVFEKKSRPTRYFPSKSSSITSRNSSMRGSSSYIDIAQIAETEDTPAEIHSEDTVSDMPSNNNVPLKPSVIMRTVPVPKPRQPRSVHDYVNVSNKNGKLVPVAVPVTDTGNKRKPSINPPVKPKPSKRLHSPQAVRTQTVHENIQKGRSNSVPLYGSPPVLTQNPQGVIPEGSIKIHGGNLSSDADNRQSHYAVTKIDYTSGRMVSNEDALSGTPIMSDSDVSAYCDNTSTNRPPSESMSTHYAVTDIVTGISVKPLPLREANKNRKRGCRPITTDYDNVTLSPDGKSSISSYENISFPNRDFELSSTSRDSQISLPEDSSLYPTETQSLTSFSFSNPASADNDVVLRGSGISSRTSADTQTDSTDYEEGW